MTIAIDVIRECFEGAVPATVATASPDGTPNVSYVSQVHYVDRDHVALSFQFFSKTRENVLANPRATVLVIHPPSAAQYRLSLRYLRTETEGPLFESMKARLAGIASHEGMSAVFRLRGSDVYRVLGVERVHGACVPSATRRNHVSAVRNCAVHLAAATDLAQLLDKLLDGLGREFGIEHAMVLMADEANQRLYTVASRGYDASGVGSEIRFGEGVIGVAARERTPIRITYMQSEYAYGRTVRDALAADDRARALEAEIPFPGLPDSGSQLAVPIVAGAHLLGVLYVESPENGRFGYDDEDALVALACQLAPVAVLLNQPEAGAADDPPVVNAARPVATGRPVRVRHYAQRQRVRRRGLPHQGCRRGDPVEAAPRPRRPPARRVQQPRAAPRSVDPAARALGEPRGAAGAARKAAGGALPVHPPREDRSRPLPPLRRAPGRTARRRRLMRGAGGDVVAASRSAAQRSAACAGFCCGTKTMYGVSTGTPGAA